MKESNKTPTVLSSASKEKKAKIFYEHGKDALELALSVANTQEEKALRKAERHHQPQVGKSRAERKNGGRASEKRTRMEEAKAMIAKRQAEAKEKARSRKGSSRLQEREDVRIKTPEDSASALPRKRVSFA